MLVRRGIYQEQQWRGERHILKIGMYQVVTSMVLGLYPVGNEVSSTVLISQTHN